MSASVRPTRVRARVVALTVAIVGVAAGCGQSDSSGAAPPSAAVLTADTDVGYELAPGASARLAVGTHCGVRTLDTKLNGQVWRTEETDGVFGWVPDEWRDVAESADGPFFVEATLSSDGTVLTLSSEGRSVDYTAAGTEFATADLCD